MTEKSETLPALAAAIAERFPELEGRAIAVSEVNPFDSETSRPTLPIAVVALIGVAGTQSPNGGGAITLADRILVQMIFDPVKYASEAGDTPFWAYYNYEAIRDRMLALTQYWRTPRNGGLSFASMDVTADDFAVSITFEFVTSEKWCDPEDAPAPIDFTMSVGILPAAGCCPPQDCPEPDPPCDDARKENPQGRENWDQATKDQWGPIKE